MSYDTLIGYHRSFNTLAFAISTVDKLQDLKDIQPKLVWKPLKVIRKTLKETTQWSVTLNHYPLKVHHVSRFSWENRSRSQEDISMNTVSLPTRGLGGSNCSHLFFGLLSICMNTYHITSNKSVHIVKGYQDFMRYERVPAYLHRALAPEQKVEKIIDSNRKRRVKHTWSEAGHPNQNLFEQ